MRARRPVPLNTGNPATLSNFWKEVSAERERTIRTENNPRNENVSSFEIQGLRIDFLGHRVFIEEKEIPFSALEFKLLSFFVRNPDRVLSRERILNNVDFPAPFGPMRPIRSPDSKTKVTESNNGRTPNDF